MYSEQGGFYDTFYLRARGDSCARTVAVTGAALFIATV